MQFSIVINRFAYYSRLIASHFCMCRELNSSFFFLVLRIRKKWRI